MAQRSLEWLQKKKGVVSSTVLKNIMGGPAAYKSAFYEIIAQRLTKGVEEDYENDTDRGNRLEPEAKTVFEFNTGLKVDTIGFLESDDNQFIGLSPDGLIGETEAIEIKCPAGKNHVRIWLENKVPEVTGCDYMDQVIQYFVVHEKLQTLYFVSYNPLIPVHPMHIIKVHREDIALEIDKAKKKTEAFLLEVESTLQTIIKL